MNRCLDMRPYLADGEAGDLPTVYDLFGVVYHYGAVFGGHYIAAARFFNWKSVESSPKDFPGISISYQFLSMCSVLLLLC